MRWILEEMKGWFEIKLRGILGPDEGDDKEVTILGRIVKWESWGFSGKRTQNIGNLSLNILGSTRERGVWEQMGARRARRGMRSN